MPMLTVSPSTHASAQREVLRLVQRQRPDLDEDVLSFIDIVDATIGAKKGEADYKARRQCLITIVTLIRLIAGICIDASSALSAAITANHGSRLSNAVTKMDLRDF
ncbi:hypothetical protein COCC4DRAFT_64902 [Bipolaris maydis ATCC 48331]|uniref:Uncharacterized protein n=2 Tax=Cochliobolus heterostrophus TaxID=5016 RepID=M2US62_COCH5|nr:uncharacterized protein COCC4DRAFT_64902 [Bipolaris maydis ATCC 48331]EMD96406.1 hypothetical protein COCHEDRAFT_21316 [Bipolaris maydis C5]EMD97572.1 hypothetical protein COCHEDRAFT_1151202 [Bipolaris maydis C5]ENI01069.1 hypothetical protein COCC4DRAFT_64902 [Bipolaris maydis ATCC 48331]